MKLHTVNIAELTGLITGWQRRFSLPGITDLIKNAPH